MQGMSKRNTAYFNELLSELNTLPWFTQWLYPRAMKMSLMAYGSIPSLEHAFAVCRAYLENTGAFQCQYFSALYSFSFSSFVFALRILNRAGVLTGEYAQANFNAVVAHRYPSSVASAL